MSVGTGFGDRYCMLLLNMVHKLSVYLIGRWRECYCMPLQCKVHLSCWSFRAKSDDFEAFITICTSSFQCCVRTVGFLNLTTWSSCIFGPYTIRKVSFSNYVIFMVLFQADRIKTQRELALMLDFNETVTKSAIYLRREE